MSRKRRSRVNRLVSKQAARLARLKKKSKKKYFHGLDSQVLRNLPVDHRDYTLRPVEPEGTVQARNFLQSSKLPGLIVLERMKTYRFVGKKPIKKTVVNMSTNAIVSD